MTQHPCSQQFQNAPPSQLRRHDPEDQKLQALPSPAAVIKSLAPPQLITHAFPCRKGQAFALVAFQHEPSYSIFPIALQDRSGRHSFSATYGLVETGDPILPFVLFPERSPRTIREAIEAVQDWLRIAIDGLPVVRRVI